MPFKGPSGMPLTKEEIIKLKHQIEPNDYLVVHSGQQQILVIRTQRKFPDIVNDLENIVNKLDLRDVNQLSHALIIGDEEVVGIPLDAIDTLMTRRTEDDERIASDLGEKLIEPYTTLLFESDNDPMKTLRLGIRIAGNLKELKPQQLPEILFSKIKSLPRHSEVIYLLAEDGYLRLSGSDFYRRLREFLRKNPNKNKELASEFVYMTRGKLADHFIEKGSSNGMFDIGRQENINKYIPEDDPRTEVEDSDETVSDLDSQKSRGKISSHRVPLSATAESILSDTTVHDQEDPPQSMEGVTEPPAEAKEEPATVPELESEHDVKEPDADVGLGSGSGSPKHTMSATSFIIKLQEKLSETGFEVIHGVDIPGVDLVANNPESIINRIFFSYMPEFILKKALALERSITRSSPDLAILIGTANNSELKLFIVGKNILLTDVNAILNTNLLVRLEEHI